MSNREINKPITRSETQCSLPETVASGETATSVYEPSETNATVSSALEASLHETSPSAKEVSPPTSPAGNTSSSSSEDERLSPPSELSKDPTYLNQVMLLRCQLFMEALKSLLTT